MSQLEISYPRISHESRVQPDGRTVVKVLRAEILIGQHRFVEEVVDQVGAWDELGQRARNLRTTLENLPR